MATQLIAIYIMKVYSQRRFIEHFGGKIHTEIIIKHDFFCLECKHLITGETEKGRTNPPNRSIDENYG